MKRSILRDLVILLGIFGLIWVVASLFSYPEDPQLLSVEREEKLGEAYVEMILLNPMFGDSVYPEVDSTVEVIGARLRQGLKRSEYEYKFLVVDSNLINAFTVPGGHILITTGLILFCESPEELASVMAHEMGHVENRHVLSRLVKELGIDLLTSGDPYVAGEVAGKLVSTRFDRKQEEEADRYALELLEASHIEPRTLATVFQRLEEESGNKLLEHFEIISTHPNFHSRIREALSHVPAEGFESKNFDLDWERVQAALE